MMTLMTSMEEVDSLPLVTPRHGPRGRMPVCEPLPVAAPRILIPADGVGSIAISSPSHASDYRAQNFEHHLDVHDLVPDSLGGEKLEKYRWVLHPGGKGIGTAGPPTPRSPARPA